MTQAEKSLKKLESPQSDSNWTVEDLVNLLEKLGFTETTNITGKKSGTSHRKFKKNGIPDLVNLQSGSDGKAKRYQVKQVREIVEKLKVGK